MSPHEMENVVYFTVDHHDQAEALYQMRFQWPIADRPKGRYPVCFNADEINKWDQHHPSVSFADGDSTIVRSLVASLIGNGQTGVHTVAIASARVIKIYYDPMIYKPHLLKADINDILRDVNRHGWTISLGWLKQRLGW